MGYVICIANHDLILYFFCKQFVIVFSPIKRNLHGWIEGIAQFPNSSRHPYYGNSPVPFVTITPNNFFPSHKYLLFQGVFVKIILPHDWQGTCQYPDLSS